MVEVAKRPRPWLDVAPRPRESSRADSLNRAIQRDPRNKHTRQLVDHALAQGPETIKPINESMTWSDTANRLARPITWISVVAIAGSVAWLARTFPVDRALDGFEIAIGDLGPWAPLVFAVMYAVAVVFLVPGSVLTLAAGAMFGPAWGMASSSLGATAGAVMAFIIARAAGRQRFAGMIENHPRFRAMDRAIGDGGWKVVALLRLIPFMPFGLSNYLFGLTAVRLVPYALASWLFMLPGGFMWVYFGHVGREGLATASGAGSASGLTWTLRLVALLASVAVVLYITARARRLLQQQTLLHTDDRAMNDHDSVTDATDATDTRPAGWPWGATVSLGLAVIMLAVGTWAWMQRDAIRARLGPPTVVLTEAHTDTGRTMAPPFDHSTFDALLKKHVNADGWVDYDGLHDDSAQLDEYLTAIARAPFDTMSRNEKLALLINAYNAATLRLILDFHPVKSIKDIPSAKRWDHKRWVVGGHTLSLNDIEHKQIRPKFNEPRIHFALVCAAVGCPKLRNEAFDAARIDAQLDDQMRYAHEHDRWLRFDADRAVLRLTKLYDWYGSDFTQTGMTVQQYAARYSAPLKKALDEGRRVKVRWLDYSWVLNSRANAR